MSTKRVQFFSFIKILLQLKPISNNPRLLQSLRSNRGQYQYLLETSKYYSPMSFIIMLILIPCWLIQALKDGGKIK